MVELPDDIYPAGDQWGGGFVQLSSPSTSDAGLGSDEDTDFQDNITNDTNGTLPSTESWPEPPADPSQEPLSLSTPTPPPGLQTAALPSGLLPNLKRLALINIVSATTHRGTDSAMRTLVRRVKTFIYWNSFNILFPIVRTTYEQLEDLTLIEPSEPAWHDGTWQEHAAVFEGMRRLRVVTMINNHMSKRFLIPVLEALFALESLNTIRLISTEDELENLDMIFDHILQSNWSGTLEVAMQDDLGADPVTRDWCVKATRRLQEEEQRQQQQQQQRQQRQQQVGATFAWPLPSLESKPEKTRKRELKLKTTLFRSEWDDDAGLRRLCLQAWQRTS
ncbi:hypothetical protein BGZ83_009247 [Gryganskiella cystojenkinii]|nr:hypothetical protein BGZ83_009247 [Gryganskiella cystojenkinii]